MEAHGVATPECFSRADPPFDVILDEMARYLGVATAAAGPSLYAAYPTTTRLSRSSHHITSHTFSRGGRACVLIAVGSGFRRATGRALRLLHCPVAMPCDKKPHHPWARRPSYGLAEYGLAEYGLA